MKAIVSTLFITIFSFSLTIGQGLFDNLTSQSVGEDDKKSTFELNGYARGAVYGGSKLYDYSNAFSEFSLKAQVDHKKTFMVADLRLREGVFFDKRDFQIQLKEAYAGYKGEKMDLFLGNQIVAWGRTDGFNPTNNITPNDYFFLTYEPDDQKLSNFMLRTKFRPTTTLDVELIAIPFYRPSVYRYDLFNLEQPATFAQVAAPELKFGKGSLAAKVNLEQSFIGASASYFVGYNPFYGFALDNFSLSPLLVNYRALPYFMQSFGADFAIPIKSWILRGEMALNLTKDYETEMNIPNPDFSYVFGIEKSFLDITAIFQYVGKYTMDFKELVEPSLTGFTPEAMYQYASDMIVYESTLYNRRIFNQQKEINHMLFLSLNRAFYFDQLNVELTGAYNLTTEEHMIRSRVKWSVTDALSANLGCSFMLGPDKTMFNMAGKVMNGVFLGLEVKF